jgi:2-(1,2-epoxy-1,2-dihydrophenyl)acetyl-CoA isomerase
VGFTRAAELAMLGERVTAPQALEWGLVNRVVPDDALVTETESLGRRLAAGPTQSYAGTKRQLNATVFGRLEEQLELEADVQQEMAGSSDFVEGVSAFVAKRQAVFTGT